MGVLRLAPVALFLFTACYSPSFDNCTVACTSTIECAGGQVCGADRFCALPNVASRCVHQLDAGTEVDARSDAATPVDASAPPPDARSTVELHITIIGKGKVALDSGPSCSSGGAQDGDCSFTLPAGGIQTLRAIQTHSKDRFERWTSTTCAGWSPTCITALGMSTIVTARFIHDADNGDN